MNRSEILFEQAMDNIKHRVEKASRSVEKLAVYLEDNLNDEAKELADEIIMEIIFNLDKIIE